MKIKDIQTYTINWKRQVISMHSFIGDSCIIHYNGDMSGEIYIIEKSSESRIKVEADDILEFVAEHIRSQVMGEIESANWKRFLK